MPEQRQHIANLVGIEEAEALVDVGAHAMALERRLELAVVLAGAEQHRDVAGAHGPRHPGADVPYGRAAFEQPGDLASHALGTRLDTVGEHGAEDLRGVSAGSADRKP